MEGAELGTAYVRLDGLERMYGGEARLVNALLNAVPQDLAPRAGVAEAKFPAFVAAREASHQGPPGPTDAASFLAPHSVDLLPVPADLKVALHRFGLHTMGDVASMTETSLVDRFGSEGRRAWHLSRGMDDSPVIPLAHVETVVEHAPFPSRLHPLNFLSPWLTPSLRGPSPVPRCGVGTLAKRCWSAS